MAPLSFNCYNTRRQPAKSSYHSMTKRYNPFIQPQNCSGSDYAISLFHPFFSGLQNGCRDHFNRLMRLTSELSPHFWRLSRENMAENGGYEKERAATLEVLLGSCSHETATLSPSSTRYHWLLHLFLPACSKLNLQPLELQQWIHQSAGNHWRLKVADSFSPHLLLPLQVMF